MCQGIIPASLHYTFPLVLYRLIFVVKFLWCKCKLGVLNICIMYQLKIDMDKLNAVKVVVS